MNMETGDYFVINEYNKVVKKCKHSKWSKYVAFKYKKNKNYFKTEKEALEKLNKRTNGM